MKRKRKSFYGKSILEMPITIKIGRKKTLTVAPMQIQEELNRLKSKRTDVATGAL